MHALSLSSTRSIRGSAVLLALMCCLTRGEASEARIALVVGNDAYRGGAALVNAANDARAVAGALADLGFSVLELRNGTKAQMLDAIARAAKAVGGQPAVALFYYAGHGIQLDWRNYLIPVDAQIASAQDVVTQAIDISQVLFEFKRAGTRTNVLILDACRNNPFGNAASGHGLAQMDAPPGTFLAYATAPGNVAEDGKPGDANGLYTQNLLRELIGPQTRIEDVFKRVRLNVRRQSSGRQVPWESTSLEEDFFFRSSHGVEVRNRTDAQNALLAEKADWDTIKASARADDFYAFLNKYPNGFISEQAQFRLDLLQSTSTIQTPNREGLLQASARRSRVGDLFVYDQIDGYTRARRRVTQLVTRASDQEFELNGGAEVWSQEGALLKNRTATYSPGILLSPADMSVGKTWKTAYTGARSDGKAERSFWNWRVVNYETISIPMGTIKTYRVVGRGEVEIEGETTFMEATAWFDPTTTRRVRYERTDRRSGQVSQWFLQEAVSYKRSEE